MKRDRIFAAVGIRWIQLSALGAVILYMWLGLFSAMAALAVMLLLMRYYYDPERELPSHPLGVMSPVDGVIMDVRDYHDPFLDRQAQRIRIDAGILRTYHERSPTEGKLVEYWPLAVKPGMGYEAELKASAWWIQTDEDDDVVMVAMPKPGWGWLRPACAMQAGERVGQARRFGRFSLFSTVDILVEKNTFLKVEPGQKVRAGIDTLATFNHDSGNIHSA